MCWFYFVFEVRVTDIHNKGENTINPYNTEEVIKFCKRNFWTLKYL